MSYPPGQAGATGLGPWLAKTRMAPAAQGRRADPSPADPPPLLRNQNMPSDACEQVNRLNQKLLDLYHQGDFESAATVADQTRALAREEFGEDHRNYARSLENLSEAYRALGNRASAETVLSEALSVKRTAFGPDHLEVADVLNKLATTCREMGDHQKAEELFIECLGIRRAALGEEHHLFAGALNNLADLYREMGRYSAAEPLLRRAEQIFRSGLSETHPDYTTCLNNLALLLRCRGDFSGAEELYRKILEIDKHVLGEIHPHFATDLNNLAELLHAQGDLKQAGPLYFRSAEIRRQALGETHPEYANSLTHLAVFYAATGREAQALDCAEKAAAIDDQQVRQAFEIESESRRIAFLQTFQGKQDIFLSIVAQFFSECPAAVKSALQLTRRRKQIRTDASASKRDVVLGLRYPELKSKLQRLLSLRMQSIGQAFASQAGGTAGEVTASIAEKQELELDVAKQAPELRAQLKMLSDEREVIRRALPQGADLVEFVRYNVFDFNAAPAKGQPRWRSPRYLAFVTWPGKEDGVHLVDLGEAATLDRSLAAHQQP